MFARCWLLVEGETEFWILPELARLVGYDFNLEGIAVVEFAQCGIAPLLRFAQELGIEWHVLADGDRTGKQYALEAQGFVRGEEPSTRVTRLKEPDIEHFFWRHGYADVYAQVAGANVSAERRITPRRVIDRAVKRRSKPYLALEILAAVTQDGSPGLPRVLERLIVTCVSLAREASARVAGEPRRPEAQGRRHGRRGHHR
jgi:putative ATP-dependent endonuclease of OLD family